MTEKTFGVELAPGWTVAEATSDADLIQMLREGDWQDYVLTVTGKDGKEAPAGAAFQLCPYCIALLPLDQPGKPFREGHILYHEAQLARLRAAQAAGGAGL